MRTTTLIVLLGLLLLTGCAQTTTQQDCSDLCAQQEQPAQACEERHCAFDFSFDDEHYYKLQYVSGKPILSSIDASDCDELFEAQHNATKYLCKLQHAEILREAGRVAGKDAWQWQLDCACSYQP